MNPLICIRGSASPGHSYPMTSLYVRNTGDSPMKVTYSANPGDAMSWLKASPVEILPGESASIPLTLVVPSNASSGENYVILTAGGTHFDVRFSVGVPPPRECLAAGYKPLPGTSPLVFLWLIVPVMIILVVFWLRSRGNGLRLRFERWPLLWGIRMAAGGAVVASMLAGGDAAIAGAAIGAITGAFAPSVADRIREWRRNVRGLGLVIEPDVPWSPARLLDPRLQLVGFSGRENELRWLVNWCMDEHAARLTLITGPGGVGKTRLSVELASRMAHAGWRCERIADGQEQGAIAALRRVTRDRALLVVDYAETRVGLKTMLKTLASDDGNKLKVLLLARSAGDWWEQLGITEPAVWDMVQAARLSQLALSPIVDADLSDSDIVAEAVRSFAQKLGLPEKAVEIYGYGGGRRRVLDLHAAALVALLKETNSRVVQVNIREVLGELLRHEKRFWYGRAKTSNLSESSAGISELMLRQVVAAGCLIGAATKAEARDLSRRIPGLSPSEKVAEWLRDLYPPDCGDSDYLGSLQPDRLAELHTIRELIDSAELSEACLTHLDARQARRAVTLLARAASDDPDAEVLSRVLPDVGRFIADLDVPLEALTAVFNVIPYPTLAILAAAAAALGERIIDLLPDDTHLSERAYWSSSFGIRLSAVGRSADALRVTEQAVSIYRELAAADPDRHCSSLARSLHNLAIDFAELCRLDDALAVSQEAVSIYRELAAADPDRYRPDLAGALYNLGASLSKLGRPADALPETQQAVSIYRELAAIDPDRYRPDLAGVLNNLGGSLSKLRCFADALRASQEAVSIYRELVAADPDRHASDLAAALDNLAIGLSELGRSAEANAARNEATRLRSTS